jgi:hypothetical protein
MIRRSFLRYIPLLASTPLVLSRHQYPSDQETTIDDRSYWVDKLCKITGPVLNSLATQQLKSTMPVECVKGTEDDRRKVTHLEAFGRSLVGLAPWLELGADISEEGKLRKKFIELARASIKNAVDPSSKDFLNFKEGRQPLVDTAFFAHALLRAPKQLWEKLDRETQQQVLNALRSSRVIEPYQSNWLLFASMVEAALLKFSGDYDSKRLLFGLEQHETWYKGDGMYGDGPSFHFDYYNSFVIQPMLLDVLKTYVELKGELKEQLEVVTKRAIRYADIQERLIAPDGSFPPIGRSLAYRCGAFQHLSQIALQKQLPPHIKPSQVRSALTAVIRKTIDAPGTFDKDGWLHIGFAGHQPSIGESYISTGSLYLCTSAFLPLGLPASDEFWSSPAVDWTSKMAFQGLDIKIDKAL